MAKKEKKQAWVAMLSAYVLAIVAGGIVYLLADSSPVWERLAVADGIATLIIFGFSVTLGNSSMYDPYWSVIPPFLALGYFFHSSFPILDSLRGIVVGVLVMWWALRLTYNFGRGWPGLRHQDWRYDQLQEQMGSLYWPISFLGIHFFPTVLVFLGCLSLWPVLLESSQSLNLLDLLALLITAAAILIEGIADRQLKNFRDSKPPREAILKSGLWAWSRHPNYLGELMFWWGLWLFGYAANPDFWWTLIGPLAMTFLFTVVSIPMMDRRMRLRRPAYKAHMRKVPALFPWKGPLKED